ncbi:hypothetical protein FQN57_003845 [Myotisia sp. PD_48]|nr:hypothetical protein FQN57_003845 [Myotisia sp. PD_48]
MHPRWSLISVSLGFILLVSSAPLIPQPRDEGSCPVPFPRLESQRLTEDDGWGTGAAFWNFLSIEDEKSGGTPAFSAKGVHSGQAFLFNHTSLQNNSADILSLESADLHSFHRYRVIDSTVYPWNTIGRIFFQRFKGDKGGWCTGTLVGRSTMLTASHCFPWGYGSYRWMRFIPGYGYGNQSEPFGGSHVSQCRGIRNTHNVTGVDYVICQLCEPLGDTVGWMGTRWWDNDSKYLHRPWFSSGYPVNTGHGQVQIFLTNLTLDNVDPHRDLGVELESQVFASPGWSGGPLWGYIDGQPSVVGVCSGAEKSCSEQPGGCYMGNDNEPYHDVSAGGKLMVELVDYGKTHWDA